MSWVCGMEKLFRRIGVKRRGKIDGVYPGKCHQHDLSEAFQNLRY